MSWFARSIANTLLSADDRDTDGEDPHPSASYSPGSPSRGVREDLSELTDALANRFQGLASFLAAPTPGGQRRLTPRAKPGRDRGPLPRGARAASGPPGRRGSREDRLLSTAPGRRLEWDRGRRGYGGRGHLRAGRRHAARALARLPPSPRRRGLKRFVRSLASLRLREHLLNLNCFLILPCWLSSADFDMTDAQQDHALAVESVAPELADLRIELCPGHMSEGCFWKIYFVLLHPKLTKEDAELLSTPQVLEAREQLSQNFQYQTKLESNEDTVAPTISNADGTVATPVEVVPSLKDQDASARATSFGNVDYGILETIHLDDAPSKDIIGDAGAVSSDNISSSVCVQLVPVLRDATELSQSEMEESIHALSKEDATESRIEESTPDFTAEDAEADEQTVTLVDSFPSKEDQRKQPVSDFYERSKVIIQKADNDDTDDDGDEWLEDTDGSGSTPIQIADDDEDVSFSDLEEDDDAA
ncbi:hypothetical protein ACQ4PT_067789 [Festuca glaucescens]